MFGLDYMAIGCCNIVLNVCEQISKSISLRQGGGFSSITYPRKTLFCSSILKRSEDATSAVGESCGQTQLLLRFHSLYDAFILMTRSLGSLVSRMRCRHVPSLISRPLSISSETLTNIVFVAFGEAVSSTYTKCM